MGSLPTILLLYWESCPNISRIKDNSEYLYDFISPARVKLNGRLDFCRGQFNKKECSKSHLLFRLGTFTGAYATSLSRIKNLSGCQIFMK